MKHFGLIFLLILTSLLLTSCLDTYAPDNPITGSTGYLKIVNTTNAPITVTWAADNSIDVVEANSYTTFEFGLESSITGVKGISTSYTCEGEYLYSENFSNIIYENQTTVRTLDADCGCLKLVNSTNAPMTVTWTSDNSYDIVNANSLKTFKFLMRDSKNNPKGILTSYTCEGLYIQSQLFTDMINVGQTTIRSMASNPGFLKIENNTNADVVVSWYSDNSQNIIPANSNQNFEIGIGSDKTGSKSISISYSCSGLYLHTTEFTDHIYAGQTSYRTLNPDKGCINFVNNTSGYVLITVPGMDDPITIGAHSNYTQSWLMTGYNANTTFSCTGDFVFSETNDLTVHVNNTGTRTINATGAAIKVLNNSSVTISSVYLSPHSDTTWGSDDLSGTIAPGEYVTWTVSAIDWDVKVVDSQANYAAWSNNGNLALNEMLVINYDMSKQNHDISNKTDGIGSSHEGQFRIQQIRK